jgi:two-component system nitrogen regulation response regulator GlnG
MSRILIVDDEVAICFALGEYLRAAGHSPVSVASGRHALQRLEEEDFDLVFLDLQMPGIAGLEVLETVHQRCPRLPVVIITAHGSMQTTIRAMQLGAHDYITKPIDLERIGALLERALRPPSTEREVPLPPADDTDDEHTLLGSSPVMQELFKHIGVLTTNDLTVLLQGESGVGKERVARAIHHNSARAQQPFIAVNCAAMPENLLENELFGHDKGAFTGAEEGHAGKFELAGAGTVMLDEMAELSLPLQAKLLRVLEGREFFRVGGMTPIRLRARVIAASNRDLGELVRDGEFRHDLYYRLHVAAVTIPPLRERPEDIPALVAHFLRAAGRRLSKEPPTVDRAGLELLVTHPWPGNVRELENLIHRACAFARYDVLSAEDIRSLLTTAGIGGLRSTGPVAVWEAQLRQEVRRHGQGGGHDDRDPGLFHRLMIRTEEILLDEALAQTGGNQVQAARLLGMQRSSFRKKLRRHDEGENTTS